LGIITKSISSVRTKIGIPGTVLVVDSLNLALMLSSNDDAIDKVYVIGGETVYKEAIKLSSCSKIYLTEVLTEITEIPSIPNRFKMVALSITYIENKVEYRFIEYENFEPLQKPY
jgi:dihydrofolate reductase / thymidylate synthase